MFDFKNNSNESKMSKTEKYLREGRGGVKISNPRRYVDRRPLSRKLFDIQTGYCPRHIKNKGKA
jgi:hypothetical protein